MKKISPKELNLLLILGGVLIFVVLYTYLFTPMRAEVADMRDDIASIEQKIKELEVHSAYAAKYQEKTEAYRAAINEKLAVYPADIKEEDIVAYMLKMEEANDIEISSIAFAAAQELTSFQGVVNQTVQINVGSDEEAEELEKLRQQSQTKEVATDMKVFRTGATVSAELSYQGLKDTINYIYNSGKPATLDSISVSYSSETNNLNGSLNISRYYITYPEAVYTPEELPDVAIGADQLFGD